MAKITVLGLGPGRAGLITRESWQIMEQAATLILRTRIHPTVAALEKAGLLFTTYDGFYEQAESFEALYTAIARDLLQRAAAGSDLGHNPSECQLKMADPHSHLSRIPAR